MAEDITRRSFVRAASIMGLAVLGGGAFGLAGCGESPAASSSAAESAGAGSSTAAGSAASSAAASSGAAAEPSSSSAASAAAGTAAVVFYSRADENYQVGTIDEGNTAKVAKEIAAQTGAALVEVKPVNAYPTGYDECCDVALAEQDDGARPALQEIPDLSAYDTIYLGYPIWWGDLPMLMYTLLEAEDWAGKTIMPFNTHEGSGNAGTYETIADLCPDATVGEGLALRGTVAQQDPETVSAEVAEWLAS